MLAEGFFKLLFSDMIHLADERARILEERVRRAVISQDEKIHKEMMKL